MKRPLKRTPRGYNGNQPTSRSLSTCLPDVLGKIGQLVDDQTDAVLHYWPALVGCELAPMTEAVSFVEGTLTVRVKNATLYSLLAQRDRLHLLRQLSRRFPSVYNLKFRR